MARKFHVFQSLHKKGEVILRSKDGPEVSGSRGALLGFLLVPSFEAGRLH